MKKSSYFLIASLAVSLSAFGYNATVVEQEVKNISIFLKDLYAQLPAQKKLAETLETIINNGWLKERDFSTQEVLEINAIIQQKDLTLSEKATAIKQIIKKYTEQAQKAAQKREKKWNKVQEQRNLENKICNLEYENRSIRNTMKEVAIYAAGFLTWGLGFLMGHDAGRCSAYKQLQNYGVLIK